MSEQNEMGCAEFADAAAELALGVLTGRERARALAHHQRRRAQPGRRSRGNGPHQMTCRDQDQVGHNGGGDCVACHGKGERVAGLPHKPHGRPVACPGLGPRTHRTTLQRSEKFKNSFIPPPIRSGRHSEGPM